MVTRVLIKMIKFKSGKCLLTSFGSAILLLTAIYPWIQDHEDVEWSASSFSINSPSNIPDAVTWNHNCIPGSLPDNELNLYELYEGVETFVMFIGYPRSSHSLMGAILDAHPHMVISHEYHIVNRWSIYQDDTLINTGMQKYLLFYNLHSLSTWQAVFGNRAKKPVFLDDGIYSYNVPGAWQGTFSGKIKVIGDKKGAGTTMELFEKPLKFHILKEINKTVGIPMKFIHVIRNPFDVISTWVLRLFNSRLRVNDGITKINKPQALDNFITSYFQLTKTNARIKQLYGNAVLDVVSDELLFKPRETLQTICSFLSVSCEEHYLSRVERVLYKKPSHTRNTVIWTKEQKDRVQVEMQKYSFLRQFTFD